jgi:murein DD-endopeptidase MepM/ murein hydrolase activator NlpD
MAQAPEREIFLRTGGKVRFLRVSTGLQLAVAGGATALLGGWALATGAMLWNQAHIGSERAALAQQTASVSSREAKVNAYRRSVDDVAGDIEERQMALEQLMQTSLGTAGAAEGVPGKAAITAGKTNASVAPAKPLSDASTPAERLNRLRDNQHAFETRLEEAAKTRLAQVEQAIRSFGLNPLSMGHGRGAQGGPYVPVRGLIATDPELRDLATLLSRLNAMELTLAAIPSGRPTAAPMETSSFGYRRDPFNGMAAFHAGIDFPGAYGQPIQAAERGRVSFVGQRQGYGNVVEVDHGNGILTRYAHLSRFAARVGDKVTRGQTIAKMGSTGRSTGTHLHFEVRVNGDAVNPRRFLEARQDVLEIQQLAKQRIVRSNRS